MKWSKAHAKNAVAALARRRLVDPVLADLVCRSVPIPRRPRCRISIQIRDHLRGDSLTLNLSPASWPNRWLCDLGEFSTAHLAQTVRLILQSAHSSAH